MGVYSNISAYIAPSYKAGQTDISESDDAESIEDFENQACVSIEDSEFDNFLVDLSKLPPGITHIHFWRG